MRTVAILVRKNSSNSIALATSVISMDALGASPVTFSMAPFAHRVRRGSVCARTVQSKSAKHVRQATNSEITSVVATSYMTVVSNAMLTAAQSVSMDSFSLR